MNLFDVNAGWHKFPLAPLDCSNSGFILPASFLFNRIG